MSYAIAFSWWPVFLHDGSMDSTKSLVSQVAPLNCSCCRNIQLTNDIGGFVSQAIQNLAMNNEQFDDALALQNKIDDHLGARQPTI
jgi:hypothetical protein